MSRTIALLASAAGLLLAAAPTGLAAKPPPSTATLTASASPFTLTFGATTRVSGQLGGANHAAQKITIAEDVFPYDGHFTNVATTKTDAAGLYAAQLRPSANANYRASAKGGAKALTGVRVRMRVTLGVSDATPSRGQRVRFSGSVYPKHDGRRVLLQRRNSSGAYVTVARATTLTTTTNRSRWSRSLTIRRNGHYRARIGGDGDHQTGTSRSRNLRVH